MNLVKSGVRASIRGAAMGLLTMAMGVVGCTPADNPPAIDDANTLVSCSFDDTYDTYAWDFVTLVDDADGYADVTKVYVNVIDTRVGDTVQETWDLASDGNGQWSQTIYEDVGTGNATDYSQHLDCENKTSFDIDFYAVDAAGEQDAVTFTVQ